ncbi:MAG: DUF2298 domain-containing protein [Caldilineaceae bacterium]
MVSPSARWGQAAVAAVITGVVLLVGLLLLYWPYFLTAQSQAGGIVPNLFNPTRFPQFFLMFGFALLGLGALVGLGWQGLVTAQATVKGTHWGQIGMIAAVVYGVPILFLLVSAILVTTARGQRLLAANLPLPADATSYLPFITERWLTSFWTFLIVGAFLVLVLWLIWRYVELFWGRYAALAPSTQTSQEQTQNEQITLLFVLLLGAVGLLLVYAPEFVYLRDNFGTRMNTVFKFYYQAWLLFGLVLSYVVVVAFADGKRTGLIAVGTKVCAGLSFVIALSGLIFPVAAAYSKTGGFATTPTFDATAYLVDKGRLSWLPPTGCA